MGGLTSHQGQWGGGGEKAALGAEAGGRWELGAEVSSALCLLRKVADLPRPSSPQALPPTVAWSPAASPVPLRGGGRDPAPALLQPSPSSVLDHGSRTVCVTGAETQGTEGGGDKKKKKKTGRRKTSVLQKGNVVLHSVSLGPQDADPESEFQVQVRSPGEDSRQPAGPRPVGPGSSQGQHSKTARASSWLWELERGTLGQ